MALRLRGGSSADLEAALLNRVIGVPKNYAAGLEIHCPGGVCIKLGRNSQLSAY